MLYYIFVVCMCINILRYVCYVCHICVKRNLTYKIKKKPPPIL